MSRPTFRMSVILSRLSVKDSKTFVIPMSVIPRFLPKYSQSNLAVACGFYRPSDQTERDGPSFPDARAGKTRLVALDENYPPRAASHRQQGQQAGGRSVRGLAFYSLFSIVQSYLVAIRTERGSPSTRNF